MLSIGNANDFHFYEDRMAENVKKGGLTRLFTKVAKIAGIFLLGGLAALVIFDPISFCIGHFNAGGMAYYTALSEKIINPLLSLPLPFMDGKTSTDMLFAMADLLGGGPKETILQLGSSYSLTRGFIP